MPRREQGKVRGLYWRQHCWWISYRDSDNQRRREKCGTRAMAIALLERRRQERRAGKKLPPVLRHVAVSFGELIDAAISFADQHHSWPRDERHKYELLRELFGNCPADKLLPGQIENKLAAVGREREWSPATHNRHLAAASLAFRLGIENRLVTANPIRLIRRRRESSGRVRWLSASEEMRLRAVIEQHYPGEMPAFELALHTGMRLSEQFGLTWDCINLERRQIRLHRTKNGAMRHVPLNDVAVAALQELRLRGDATGPVMVAGRGRYRVRTGERLKSPREWFKRACRKAGIENFSWHCLRHTFASRLTMAGVGLREVQELLGHKTIAMTCRYSHLAPSVQLMAVKRLDGWAEPQFVAGMDVMGQSEPSLLSQQARLGLDYRLRLASFRSVRYQRFQGSAI